MKFIASGDFHITDKRPRCRKEKNFFQTVLRKFEFQYNYAMTNGIAAILQPGDFFDSARRHDDSKTKNLDPTRVSHKVVASIIEIMTQYDVATFWVAGQHDLRFHNHENPNTPINVLKKALLIRQAGNTPIQYGADVHIYGAAWEHPIPKVVDNNKINILLTHQMIIYRKNKLWKTQTEYRSSNNILSANNFDFIISGDNHQSFTDRQFESILINSGSMLRTTIKQTSHIPCFYVIDSENFSIEKVEFPIEPMEVVIDNTARDIQEEVSDDLKSFVQQIGDSADLGLNFKRNVYETLKSPDVDPDVRTFINDLLGN